MFIFKKVEIFTYKPHIEYSEWPWTDALTSMWNKCLEVIRLPNPFYKYNMDIILKRVKIWTHINILDININMYWIACKTSDSVVTTNLFYYTIWEFNNGRTHKLYILMMIMIVQMYTYWLNKSNKCPMVHPHPLPHYTISNLKMVETLNHEALYIFGGQDKMTRIDFEVTWSNVKDKLLVIGKMLSAQYSLAPSVERSLTCYSWCT